MRGLSLSPHTGATNSRSRSPSHMALAYWGVWSPHMGRGAHFTLPFSPFFLCKLGHHCLLPASQFTGGSPGQPPSKTQNIRSAKRPSHVPSAHTPSTLACQGNGLSPRHQDFLKTRLLCVLRCEGEVGVEKEKSLGEYIAKTAVLRQDVHRTMPCARYIPERYRTILL